MNKEITHYVGIDCGNKSHYVYAVDSEGSSVLHRSFDHSESGLSVLIDALLRFIPDLSKVAVSMESPVGGLVETLQSWGITVLTINPKQLDRFRDRFTVSGAKDDRLDALVLAQSLRTDRRLFREVRPLPSEIAELREYSREAETLQKDLRRATNQLYAKVQVLYPSLLSLCKGADDEWFWDLLTRLNSTRRKNRPGKAELDRLLRKHRIRRFSADQLLTAIQDGPMPLPSGRSDGLWHSIAGLCDRLTLLEKQQRLLKKRMGRILHLLSKSSTEDGRLVRQLLSFPGIGDTIAITILTEAYHLLHSGDLVRLRAYCGVSPVTKQSGGRRMHVMRKACNHRLRNAIHNYGRCTIQNDDLNRNYFHSLKSRGKKTGLAFRAVGERFLRILVQMIANKTLYDPRRLKAFKEQQTGEGVQVLPALK